MFVLSPCMISVCDPCALSVCHLCVSLPPPRKRVAPFTTAVPFLQFPSFFSCIISSIPHPIYWLDLEDKMSSENARLCKLNTRLLMCCDHPLLLMKPSWKIIPKDSLKPLTKHSGKLLALEKILDQLLVVERSRSNKVLIVSQFAEMVQLLGIFCRLKSFGFRIIDGFTGSTERRSICCEFGSKRHSAPPILIATTRAAGLGLNLTVANTVVLFDSDFDPVVNERAIARVFRPGQCNKVTIYRLLVRNSIEELNLRQMSWPELSNRRLVRREDSFLDQVPRSQFF